MTRHLTEVGIIATGMTLIIMAGGIDLSVGSLLALCGIVLGYAWRAWVVGLPGSIGLALAVGGAGGALNGVLVTRAGFPPLVATGAQNEKFSNSHPLMLLLERLQFCQLFFEIMPGPEACLKEAAVQS